ncbi:hypothetical protein BEP19_17060 [Ammoniphilus oxalaticus]|uniref:Uncharacterized protein n=1 Tax=Ammoniphilus oxalaticus TaxID=66863 RepID=A0A419SQ29_9BACL|nr:hypothetical protein [Ammoniphilus oxalaticus]RKD26394.1 hypothetical protein BEP19_17060 [Ammoniphilus oxalaticus]
MREVRVSRRPERSNKKIRVNSSLDKAVHEKLDRLAMACGTTKTALAAYLVDLCLENENIINYVQDQYQDTSRFRIIPTKIEGRIKFVFTEKKNKD